jgi:formylmethanofuran dehydrogenase subunit E
MKCDKCGEDTYVVFVNSNHKLLCPDCEEKNKNKKIIRRRYRKV